MCFHPDCTSRDIEFEGEGRCEIDLACLRRFEGEVNRGLGFGNAGGSRVRFRVLKDISRELRRGELFPLPPTPPFPLLAAFTFQVEGGRAVCRRFDVDDRPPSFRGFDF